MYTDVEQKEIVREMHQAEMKNPLREKDSMRKLLYITLMLLFLFSSSKVFSGICISCPNCEHTLLIEIQPAHCIRFFPDTWTCPDSRCAYSNYDGIEYCAMCGTKRVKMKLEEQCKLHKQTQ